MGVHFDTIAEGLEYCSQVLKQDKQGLLIEERLEGEEFSVQSICDGTHIAHSPPVQDHKRAFEGDLGPNTGGIGSYSCSDHSLPFLTPALVREAESVNGAVLRALTQELDEPYRGILYGNFMITRDGLKVIEYNARFGDPEILNILPIMKTDFIDVCMAVIDGRLDELDIEFDRKSTVCKWIVPSGYPTASVQDGTVDPASVSRSNPTLRTYFGAIDFVQGQYRLKGSRAIAFVGIGDTLEQAEQSAETAASAVSGPVYHRQDIGTQALIAKRVQHMQALRQKPIETLRPER